MSLLVVLRTEGNHRQGLGDVIGSVALADECRKLGDDTLFVVTAGTEAERLLRSFGCDVRTPGSLEAELTLLRQLRPDVVVLNKLNNDAGYVRALRDVAPLVVTVDDNGPGAAAADLRINPLYLADDAASGPAYVTLREEFQPLHDTERPIAPAARELLVAQGGADTYGFLPRIVAALGSLAAPLHCTVVTGPAFRGDRELDRALDGSRLEATVVRAPADLAVRMARADLAVTAGGLMMFELACVGTPAIVVCAERFEVETANRFEAAGAALNLGFGGDLDYGRVREAIEQLAADPDRRRGMSEAGRRLVDGRGSGRAAALIRERALAGARAR